MRYGFPPESTAAVAGSNGDTELGYHSSFVLFSVTRKLNNIFFSASVINRMNTNVANTVEVC